MALLFAGSKFTPYRLWEVRKAPALVLEIVAPGTKSEDATERVLSVRLGVAEYWQYDPPGERLTPGLEDRWLVKGRYVRIASPYRPEDRCVVDRASSLGYGLGPVGREGICACGIPRGRSGRNGCLRMPK